MAKWKNGKSKHFKKKMEKVTISRKNNEKCFFFFEWQKLGESCLDSKYQIITAVCTTDTPCVWMHN